MTQSELLQRIAEGEGPLCEFKEAVLSQGDLRKVFVAFANTVRSPDIAVLFLGIDDKGKPTGKVANPDQLQRDLPIWAAKCFPPVAVKPHVLSVEGKAVVAVAVPESKNAPHFPEPTYRRVGSQNVEATIEAIDEMIADRTEACRLLRRWERQNVSYELEIEHHRSGRRWSGTVSTTPLLSLTPVGLSLYQSGAAPIVANWSQVVLQPNPSGQPPLIKIKLP